MSMKRINMLTAVNEALHEEMARDERVFVIGEDVGEYGGVWLATRGLYDEFAKKDGIPDSELPKEEYVAFLASQSAKAAECGTEELIFNAKDRKEVGADAAKKANEMLKAKGIEGKLTVSEETRDIPGGVIVRQGNIESNCSVDVIAQLYKNELSSQVAEILFA